MEKTKVSDEHRKKVNRERAKRWRQKNPERFKEIQMRYYVKRALLLMQQQSDREKAQREGAAE